MYQRVTEFMATGDTDVVMYQLITPFIITEDTNVAMCRHNVKCEVIVKKLHRMRATEDVLPDK